MIKPTVVLGEQLKPPKFTLVEWVCPNCSFGNYNKVKLDNRTYVFECSRCGAEYQVEVTWPHSLSTPTTNQKGGEIMKCGYGVAVKDVGRHNCVGCHWLMKDNTCSWKSEYGVNELDGPTSHPKPRQE